jgi:hypothetical protein
MLRKENERLKQNLESRSSDPKVREAAEKAKWAQMLAARRAQLAREDAEWAKEDAEREKKRKQHRAQYELAHGSREQKLKAFQTLQTLKKETVAAAAAAPKTPEAKKVEEQIEGTKDLGPTFTNGFWVGQYQAKHTDKERKLCPDCQPIVYNADSPLSDDDIKLMRAQHESLPLDDVILHSQTTLDKATLAVDDAHAIRGKLLDKYPPIQSGFGGGMDEGGMVEDM